MNQQKLLRRLLGATLMGVVVYGGFVFYRGFRDIGAQLSHFRWSYYVVAVALVLGNYLLRYVKWEFYLARLGIKGVPKWESLLTYFSGFVLTITPGKVGEVFKSLVLYETQGVPMAKTAPIIIAERVTDVIGVIVIVSIGSIGFRGGIIWAIAGISAVVLGLALVRSRRITAKIIELLESRGERAQALATRVRDSVESLQLITAPRLLVVPTLISVVSWSLEGVAVWFILHGLGATQTPMPVCLFVFASSTLAGALIPLPGGLGITEGSLETQLIHLAKAPQAAATSGMILTRLATLWFAVFLGFASLALLRRRYPQLLAAKTEEESSENQPDEPPSSGEAVSP